MKYVILCLLAVVLLNADRDVGSEQERIFTGLVMNEETNEPLIGATILVPGMTIGTVSDIHGRFALVIPTDTKRLDIRYGCCFGCDPYLELCGQDTAVVMIKYRKIGGPVVLGYDEVGRSICRPKWRKRISKRTAARAFALMRGER